MMNQHLQHLTDLLAQDGTIPDAAKAAMLQAVKAAEKEFEITRFKLERTEKVKRTTGILLEETIEELEQKRKMLEAQNRELEVETALERVRAVALGMNRAADMPDVCKMIARQLELLNVKEIRNVQTAIFNDGKATYQNYEYYLKHDRSFITETHYQDDPRHAEFAATMQRGNGQIFMLHINKKELASWIDYQRTTNVFIDNYLNDAPSLDYYWHSLGPVALGISTYQPLTPDESTLFTRFLKVFELAYRRWLDIEKARTQAREAQVEGALEKVRSRTMGMQQSDELKEVIRVVYDQFIQLHIDIEHTGFIIDYKNRDDMHIWLADKHPVPSEITIPYFDSPHWNSFLEARENGLDFFTNQLSFEEKNKFYHDLFARIPGVTQETAGYYLTCPGLAISTVLMENVGLYIENFSGKPYSEEDNKTLLRFGTVFQQTYTRFLDLQKAEAQAREARIEASLERVRSRTLAMQHSDELAETSAVLFRQLIGLGMEPNRLYITLVKDDEGTAEFWITDEDGSRVSSAYIDNLNDNASFQKMYAGWKAGKKSMMIDMQGKELEEYFRHLTSLQVPFKDGIKHKRRIQHLAYFNRGFIGMAAPHDQPRETIHLLERFAAVFNLTYTRFNDLTIAEAHAKQAEADLINLQHEKKRAEDALSELQVTQRQLIQSEKMASLGELTAGIAHEIQNPLNFVNNFSEVSKELLEEMKVALDNGDDNEAKAIMQDVIQNLEKINHHGRRADAIVKGMMQHSRKDAGARQSTDINALAEEYFRLSYHGLRARDKSFSCHFSTHFDPAIGNIEMAAQDIGRVLLNLFTNAFYAVQEKAKQLDHPAAGTEAYHPEVKVSTQLLHDQVEVRVGDNGTGIPQAIIDKIFQPFYTTKPTGKGTGLGLSLAYDIITKEHHGTIEADSKAGEGTVFIIRLPVTQAFQPARR